MRSLSVIWTDPLSIRFKISPHCDLSRFAPGDWDIDRRHKLESSAKYQSIVERYSEGKPWEQTRLFADLYRKRFESGESIRGQDTMKGLLAQYYGRVDAMFEDMKRNGFVKKGALPKLLVGRAGEVFIGNQGNHRLAMAHVLKLDRFAGEIICRHRMV
jgi:hypothetical protein